MVRVIIISFAALILSACTPSNIISPGPSPVGVAPGQSPEVSAIPQETGISPLVITLAELQNSGQSGIATFSQVNGGKTRVMLKLSGGNFTDPQPAHIHEGTCPAVGDIRFPLNTVIDGESETVLDMSLQEMESFDQPLAINVHKSARESDVYTACGDLIFPSGTTGTGMSDEE